MQNRLTATLCVCCVYLCVSVVAFKPLFTVCRCLIYGESLGKITHTPRCRWQCNRTHNKYLCRRFLFCVLCNYTRTHTVATLTTLLAHTHPHTRLFVHIIQVIFFCLSISVCCSVNMFRIFTFPCIHYAWCGYVCVCKCVRFVFANK